MSAAQEWLASAPEGLVQLIRRITWHHKVRWNAPDYIAADEWPEGAGDGREATTELGDAEAISSAWTVDPMKNINGGFATHALVIDIDVPAWLVPSSTPGHSHLYVDLPVIDGDLWAFLDAAAAIGLVEAGYVSACKSRGMTSVRAPWVIKGQEPSSTTPNTADEEAF